MAVHFRPDGFHTVTPYLQTTDGAKLLEFLKAALGAEVIFSMEKPDGRIGHCQVQIGDSMVEFSDVTGSEHPATTAALHVYVGDVDDAYQRAMKGGGKSLREPTDQFYGDRECAIIDPVGNYWYIATHKEDLSPDEMDKRATASAKEKAS